MYSGPKFKKAIEWRICTVRPQWLFDSMTRNVYLAETDYCVHPEGTRELHPYYIFHINNTVVVFALYVVFIICCIMIMN